MPKMRHPNSSQTIEVSPDRVGSYESQGWRRVAAPKKRTTTADTATTKE
jgi:hypothetical protein